MSPDRGTCCEASLEEADRVLLRDSHHPHGHTLRFGAGEWLSLLASLS